MKTKINAVEIYMWSPEVREALTSKNLNLRDEIEEKINAIEEMAGKDIHIHGYDSEEWIVTLSRHEKSKRYKYPILILEDQEEEKEEELPLPKKWKPFLDRTILSGIGVVVCILSVGATLLLRDNPPSASADAWLSHIESQKIIQNKNNLLIAEEYEKQKKLREEIDLSIQRVKSLDQKNKDIERELILYINQ